MKFLVILVFLCFAAETVIASSNTTRNNSTIEIHYPPIVNGLYYMGCYTSLIGTAYIDSNTLDHCLQTCPGYEKDAIAIGYGFNVYWTRRSCVCVLTFSDSKRTVDSECGKNGTNINAFAAYLTTSPEDALVLPFDVYGFKSYGCYLDDADRDMGKDFERVENLFECRKICSNKNTKYMGLQAQHACFCSDSFSTKPQYIKVGDKKCNPMGNNWINTVYEVLL